jgi:hypothetical protein
MLNACDGLWDVTEENVWTKFSSVVGISVGRCHGILLDVLNVRHVCEHVVPRMLMTEQKETRTNVFGDLIGMIDKENELSNNL